MALDLWRTHNSRVFETFLPELAMHLGRPQDEVRETGILGTEFPYQWVRVYYGDDRKAPNSAFDFAFAFPLIVPTREAIAVFAQQAGYFLFNHLCIVSVRETRQTKKEKVVWDVEDWLKHRDA